MAEFSWRSQEAVGPDGTVHHHPLPTAVRVLLVVYGLALGTLILTLAIIFVKAQASDAADREQLKKEIVKAIEDDNAARLAADAKQAEGTRRIVCSLVEHDLPRSANTIALARQLKCGQTPSQRPTPQAAPVPRAPGQKPPVVIVTVQPAPQPRPGSSPHGSSSPKPHPSPSPTCRVVVLGRCLPPDVNTKEKP